MEKRWASMKLTLLLFYLGVLPLAPDIPLPLAFAFALLAVALLATLPTLARFARTSHHGFFTPVYLSSVRAAMPVTWQLLRPVTLGARGTVRSRAPSGLSAAHD